MHALMIELADYASTTIDNKLNVMGIFDVLRAGGFPTMHPLMYLVVHLAPDLGEIGETADMAIKLVDQDSTVLGGLQATLPVPRSQNGYQPSVNMVLALRDMVFPHPGTYAFEVSVDGELVGSVALQVIQVQTN